MAPPSSPFFLSQENTITKYKMWAAHWSPWCGLVAVLESH
jgi:hypothetical protein